MNLNPLISSCSSSSATSSSSSSSCSSSSCSISSCTAYNSIHHPSLPNPNPNYLDRASIAKLLQPHLLLLSLQDARVLQQPIILTATCYQSINQIIDQLILSILNAISIPKQLLTQQQQPKQQQQQQQQQHHHHHHHHHHQLQHEHQLEFQVDHEQINQSFPHNLAFDFADPLLPTDSSLNSLQSHHTQELLHSINLHEQPNHSPKQSIPSLDQPIISNDSHQPDQKSIHQLTIGCLQIPTRTKSDSLSPTASNFPSIPPQDPSSTPCSKPNSNSTGPPSKSYQHGNGTSEFVKKLYKMLEEPESESVVGWGRQKTTLVIKDQILFQRDILPKHFKHSNFASFVRQLNKYEFRKFKPQSCPSNIPSNNPDQQTSSLGERSSSCSNQKPGSLQWEFYHPHFRADTLSELDNIKRKVPATRPKPADTSLQTTDSQLGTTSWEPTEEVVNRLMSLQQETSSALNHLTQECKNLRDELEQAHNRLDFQQRQINLLTNSRASYHQPSQSQSQTEIVSQTSENTLSSIDLPTALEQTQNEPRSLNSINATSSSLTQTSDEFASWRNLNSMTIPIARLPTNKFNRWSRPPRVLVVEDDQICRTTSSAILKLMGCRIEFACDGLHAVSKMKQHTNADEPFDLVLMDIFMPNMDGLVATSLIRKFDLKTPIISMTSNFKPIDLVKYIDIGMNDCLPKPLTKQGMIVMLQKHLFDPSKQIHFITELIDNNSISGSNHENRSQSNISPPNSPRRWSQLQHSLQPSTSLALTANNLPSSSYLLDMNRSLKRSCDEQTIDFNSNDSADKSNDHNLLHFDLIDSHPDLHPRNMRRTSNNSSESSCKRAKV